MKRSEINATIKKVKNVMESSGFPFPPFASYTVEDWQKLDSAERELVDNMLGWDVTDFGTGDFANYGLTVFVFRNGNFYDKDNYPKPYAEKLLYVFDGQILPYHYHWSKMEDIINRGGGDLEITLYRATDEDVAGAIQGEGQFLDQPFEVRVDGKRITLQPGGKVILKPGQSISLERGIYHQWQAIPGTGDVRLFEVSATNDDHVDNRFLLPMDRIPSVEEDEEISYLIFADYDRFVPDSCKS